MPETCARADKLYDKHLATRAATNAAVLDVDADHPFDAPKVADALLAALRAFDAAHGGDAPPSPEPPSSPPPQKTDAEKDKGGPPWCALS